ncbi:MAG: cysteine-rich repeat protein, partial [Myxococcota bacterium]
MTKLRIFILLAAGAAISLAAALPACLAPESKSCGADGPTCPPGWICTLDNTACIDPALTLCGDGNVDEGEACDDGNLANNDGCNFDCQLPGCGDGFLDGDEVCDDANQVNGDGCSRDCQSEETCGDRYLNDYTHVAGDGGALAPEACDEGGEDTATCNADCTAARCGDGQVNAVADEQCDGGDPLNPAAVDTADCNMDCTISLCGDGLRNTVAGEECDNGMYCVDGSPCTSDGDCSQLVGDATCLPRDFECCTSTCFNPLCGNGVLEPTCEGFPLEICDDGKHCADLSTCRSDAQCAAIGDGKCVTRRATGCRQDCLSPETCGDGVTNNYPPYNEICDDGKHCADLVTSCVLDTDCEGLGDGSCSARNGTGCAVDCKSSEVCGDGILNNYAQVDNEGAPTPAEVCDNGRQCEDGTQCTGALECTGVGDGECRARNADGCSQDCLSEETCGDNYLNNYVHPMVNGQPVCVPRGQSCPADFVTLTTVGASFLGREACDDGNTLDNDGCSADCLSEEECGDGYVNDYAIDDNDEICDDGNNASGDGCAPDCRSTENCGDGVLDNGEECDDGPLNGTDVSPNMCG